MGGKPAIQRQAKCAREWAVVWENFEFLELAVTDPQRDLTFHLAP